MAKVNREIWKKILDEIERDVGSNFNFWFGQSDFEVVGDTFIIKFPNQFNIDHVKKRYDHIIKDIIEKVTLHSFDLSYRIDVKGENRQSEVDLDCEEDPNNLI